MPGSVTSKMFLPAFTLSVDVMPATVVNCNVVSEGESTMMCMPEAYIFSSVMFTASIPLTDVLNVRSLKMCSMHFRASALSSICENTMFEIRVWLEESSFGSTALIA